METKLIFKVCSIKETRGKQRVPALLLKNQQEKLSELCLAYQEILPCELLYDTGYPIENIFTEVLHHPEEKESKAIEESLKLVLESKDSKRTSDYRKELVKTAGYLSQEHGISEKPLAIQC